MADIAFLISRSLLPPDVHLIVDRASAHSLDLRLSEETASLDNPEISSFFFDDERAGIMMCTFLPVQHPDAADMSIGPLSPTSEDLSEGISHMILVGFGIEGADAERDQLMFQFAAAVCESTDAVAAMVGQAVNFQRADSFVDLVGQIPEHGVPTELAITVSTEHIDEDTISLMTHGLGRHGKPELLLHGLAEQGNAMDLIYDMASLSLSDDTLDLRSGATVGRTDDEKLLIGREQDPYRAGAEVITLTPLRR